MPRWVQRLERRSKPLTTEPQGRWYTQSQYRLRHVLHIEADWNSISSAGCCLPPSGPPSCTCQPQISVLVSDSTPLIGCQMQSCPLWLILSHLLLAALKIPQLRQVCCCSVEASALHNCCYLLFFPPTSVGAFTCSATVCLTALEARVEISLDHH